MRPLHLLVLAASIGALFLLFTSLGSSDPEPYILALRRRLKGETLAQQPVVQPPPSPPAPSLASLVNEIVGPSVPRLTGAMIARLIEWHEAGQWEEKTQGKIDAVQVYNAAKLQAEKWVPHWKPRKLWPAGYTIQVLLLCTEEDYVTRMDRIFFDSVEGIMAHPQINVTMWGPGWARWEGDKYSNAEENMMRVFGCDFFDVILFHQEHYKAGRCGNSKKAVIVQELGDCPGPCVKFFARNADVITHTYASPLWEMYDLDKRSDLLDKRRLFVHNPHCANDRMMRPAPWAPRQAWAVENHTISLHGQITGTWYPLRWRLEQGSRDGGMNVTVHQYAGWSFPQNLHGVVRPDRYDVHDPRLVAVEAQKFEFAASLQHSAVCAFDAQTMHIMLRKYPEAMLTGCPIFATLPDEVADIIRPAVFVVDSVKLADADKYNYKLKEHVNAVVEDERGRALKGAYGMIAAREHFTCHSKAERWLDAIEAYKMGAAGTMYPFSVKVGCREYPGFPRPHAWCYQDDPVMK